MAEDTRKTGKRKDSLKEKIDSIVGDSNIAGAAVVCAAGDCESLEGNLGDAIKSALSLRENVVMVRVNTESLEKLDELVEAGIVNSRSEAAAFLIAEGIKSKQEFFSQISEKLEQIRKTREELRKLL